MQILDGAFFKTVFDQIFDDQSITLSNFKGFKEYCDSIRPVKWLKDNNGNTTRFKQTFLYNAFAPTDCINGFIDVVNAAYFDNTNIESGFFDETYEENPSSYESFVSKYADKIRNVDENLDSVSLYGGSYKLNAAYRHAFIYDQKGIAIGKVLELDDFDLLSEMIRNGMIVVRDWNTKTKCSSVKDIFIKDTTFNGEITANTNKHVETADLYGRISVKQMIVYLLQGRFHDPKFVEFLSKFSPVEMLNSYYLTRDHINDKKEILSCIYNGGYVLKVVDFQYHTDYSRDEYGETVRTNVYGEDVLATELLKERCLR